ncbi:hypothetical protein [Chryseobacterium aquifrigidense]|uniref:Uncharacterized protein n=1 Tax=Chryseobacterium aquifrigidense TaxID=558021 RepID=A0A543E9S9_9FLAO|nr:hypothetical protein [Chryseobacterium aquifrigidense]TQM18328.1 hypothetical protein FB551_4109 [Chryseobacterium aquifrigidense]
MSKNLSVTLRLFYGELNYDKDGNVKSKNETVSITFESPEWDNFIKHLKAHGVTSVKVEKVYDLSKVNKDEPVESLKRFGEVEDVSAVEAVINKLFETTEKPLTPEQKQIKELQEQIAALTAGAKAGAKPDAKTGLSKGGAKAGANAAESNKDNAEGEGAAGEGQK